MHTYIHTYMHAHIHTYIHTYIHTCIHTYIHTYMHAYIHTYIQTYLHTYIHTYIHTYNIHTCNSGRWFFTVLQNTIESLNLGCSCMYDSCCQFFLSLSPLFLPPSPSPFPSSSFLTLSLPPSCLPPSSLPLQHSTADEQLIQSALDCGPCDSHMTIFDARSFSAATGNKIMVRWRREGGREGGREGARGRTACHIC